jgi:hypothetical protein
MIIFSSEKMNVTGSSLASHLRWLDTSRPSLRRGSMKCRSSTFPTVQALNVVLTWDFTSRAC